MVQVRSVPEFQESLLNLQIELMITTIFPGRRISSNSVPECLYTFTLLLSPYTTSFVIKATILLMTENVAMIASLAR